MLHGILLFRAILLFSDAGLGRTDAGDHANL